MKISENLHFLYGIYGGNVGIIKSDGEVALVDSGWTDESVELILSYLRMLTELEVIKYVFVTHADRDHIGGLHRFQKEFNAQVVIHKAEVKQIEKPMSPMSPSTADVVVKQDMVCQVGKLEFQLLCTPGHTSGSICVYNKKHALLFSGDTIIQDFYYPPMGRFIRAPNIKYQIETYLGSLKKLSNLEINWILPGHGGPIHDGKKKITELIQITKNLKAVAYDLLREKLCPSELAEKLNAWPTLGDTIINDLKNQGKVERVGVKVLQKEPTYIRR